MSGEPIVSSGPFTSALTLYTGYLCVDSNKQYRYEFRIEDTFGDRMCCGYGNGSYSLTLDGESIQSGGEFGSYDSAIFGNCGYPTPAPTPVPTNTMVDCPDKSLDITLETDYYPSETTWTLWDTCDLSGEPVAASGPFNDQETLHNTHVCVESEKQYKFRIEDSFGDGMCCGHGDGNYSLALDGEFIQSGGDFGSSDSAIFGQCSV